LLVPQLALEEVVRICQKKIICWKKASLNLLKMKIKNFSPSYCLEMSFCALSGGQIAPSNLQIKTICSLLITINGIWSNYPRAKKRLQKWNRKRKKGRNMNMSIPKQLLSQSYIPPINTSLLLSESYGSAFKSILAFNYEKIALVGSGRRSEDRKSRKKVLYYLSVLWLFHFTNRSPPVYYVMVSRKNQNHRRDVSWGSAPCTVSKFILSKISIRGWFEKKLKKFR